MKKYVFILAVFFLLPLAHVDAAFSFSRTITVNSGQVSGTQSSFPMLVSGTYNGSGGILDLRTVGNGGKVQNASGFDVGFYSNSNCSTGKLNWETEQYTASTGVVVYWVNVASITTSTVIYVCYGDASISTDQSNKTGVWDANYTGVWHMSDNAANTTVADSVTTPHNGANTANTSVVSTTGQIAKALDSHLAGDYTDAGNVLNTSWGTGVSFTLEVWFKANTFPGVKSGMITKTGNAIPGPLFSTRGASLYYEGYDGTRNPFGFSSTALSTGTWYHGVYVRDVGATTGRFYLNGAADGTITDNTTDMGSASDHLAFGNSTSNGGVFDGQLDEVRISNTNRSANWLLTEYKNQSAPASFYALGAETNIGGGVTSVITGFLLFGEW